MMLSRMARNFSLSVFSLNCLVISVVFGSSINFAFLVSQWFRPVFGPGGGDTAVSLISGVILGLGAYGLYLDSENALKTIFKKHNPWEIFFRASGLVLLNLFFVGIGILGLYFRLGFLSSRGVGYLGVAGILLECTPPIIGLVINPLVHPDLQVLEAGRIARVGRTTLGEVYDRVEELPASQRFDALYGNEDLNTLLDGAANDLKQLPERSSLLTPLTSRMKKKTPTQPTLEGEEDGLKVHG
jgi:hypothetical protein